MHVLCRCPSTFCQKLRTAGKSAGQTDREGEGDRRTKDLFCCVERLFPPFFFSFRQSVSRSHPPPSLPDPAAPRSPFFFLPVCPSVVLRPIPMGLLIRATSSILQPVARPFRRPSTQPQSGNCPARASRRRRKQRYGTATWGGFLDLWRRARGRKCRAANLAERPQDPRETPGGSARPRPLLLESTFSCSPPPVPVHVHETVRLHGRQRQAAARRRRGGGAVGGRGGRPVGTKGTIKECGLRMETS